MPYFFQCYCCKLCKSPIRTLHQRRSFWIIWITLCNTSNNFTPPTWADRAQCTIVLTFQKELGCKFVIRIRWIFDVFHVGLKQNYKHKHTMLVFGTRILCYEHILKIQFKLCSVFIWEPKLFSCILFTYANKCKRRPKQRDPYLWSWDFYATKIDTKLLMSTTFGPKISKVMTVACTHTNENTQ